MAQIDICNAMVKSITDLVTMLLLKDVTSIISDYVAFKVEFKLIDFQGLPVSRMARMTESPEEQYDKKMKDEEKNCKSTDGVQDHERNSTNYEVSYIPSSSNLCSSLSASTSSMVPGSSNSLISSFSSSSSSSSSSISTLPLFSFLSSDSSSTAYFMDTTSSAPTCPVLGSEDSTDSPMSTD